jgi:hypothetical protein
LIEPEVIRPQRQSAVLVDLIAHRFLSFNEVIIVMEKLSSVRISLIVLALVMGLTLLTGSTAQVYAYPHHYHSCSYNGWGCNYSYNFPYFGYYYYPYYSYYYPYSGYYGYSYPYSYGYGSYGYNQQYQLTLNANPSSLSNVVSGGGQYASGTSASFAASQNTIQVSQDTRYVFSHWTGDFSGSALTGSVTMDAAKTVTAVYQLQYYLSVNAQPSNAPSPQGSDWFNAGDSAMISIPSQTVDNGGARLVFNGWSVDGTMSQTGPAVTVQMNAPHTVVAEYKQQYYLTVSSEQGSVSGEGWYDAGSSVQISASTPPNPSYGINMVFNGWQGDLQSSSQSTSVLMDRAKSVTATWRTDPTVLYMTIALAFAAVAAVGVMGAYVWGRRGKPAGAAWQPAPSYAQSTQTPTVRPTITPNVEPNRSLNTPNSSLDEQESSTSAPHKRRRTHTAIQDTEPSPENSAPKAEE